jgi:hypothetical protein
MEKLPEGHWMASRTWNEAETAREWGLTPVQFRALSADEKAEMAAHVDVKRFMESYETHVRMQKLEADRRRMDQAGRRRGHASSR